MTVENLFPQRGAKACACSRQLGVNNRKGRCHSCAIRASKRQRPVPADFRIFGAKMALRELTAHYGCSTRTITRWRMETGTPMANLGPAKLPVPDDFAQVAPTMTIADLCRHYGKVFDTVKGWTLMAGVRAKAYTRGPRLIVGNAERTFANARMISHRDDSRVGRAVDYLRRFGPVVRCDAEVRYAEKGDHYRRGCSILTGAEIIDRAERNGWQPDAWKELAA